MVLSVEENQQERGRKNSTTETPTSPWYSFVHFPFRGPAHCLSIHVFFVFITEFFFHVFSIQFNFPSSVLPRFEKFAGGLWGDSWKETGQATGDCRDKFRLSPGWLSRRNSPKSEIRIFRDFFLGQRRENFMILVLCVKLWLAKW